ncbi:response regulator [Actinokineospora iranica]|uniref:response regulator n=1 Tax=Actinokineospora iranica TaxID=1271860 RepID=UPI001E34772E|nr:response regulator transcription factor [Actinokineospora iranica]
MVKLMVVDDEVLIRAGLAALLRATPGFEVVAEAADGEQAVALAAATGPEVILMDIRMPGVDGIHATERILAASPVPPRVMVLTTFDLDEYVYAALRAGAAGFLLKQTEPRQLISAIEVVAAGETLFAPSVTRRLIEAYLAHSGESPRPQAVPPGLRHLTTREREVLRHVATGKSNTEIAAALTVSEATVKTHLNRTMTKLALTSRAQAVVLAYETGLVIPRACLDADVPTA